MTSSRVSAGSADRELLRRLVDADEVLRRGIAHALHDDAVQALAASVMHLGLIPNKVQGVADLPAYTRASENLKHGIRSARDLLLRLRAPLLAEQGPGPALDQELDMVGRVTGCATRVDWAVPARHDRLLETVVFRAAQEAIVNAERHAKASTITITACLRRGALVVEVADDGARVRPRRARRRRARPGQAAGRAGRRQSHGHLQAGQRDDGHHLRADQLLNPRSPVAVARVASGQTCHRPQ